MRVFNDHTVFIGEVVSVYVDTEYSIDGIPDIAKIHPVFYEPPKKGKKESGYYYSLGKARKIGKDLNVSTTETNKPRKE